MTDGMVGWRARPSAPLRTPCKHLLIFFFFPDADISFFLFQIINDNDNDKVNVAKGFGKSTT